MMIYILPKKVESPLQILGGRVGRASRTHTWLQPQAPKLRDKDFSGHQGWVLRPLEALSSEQAA